MAGLLRGLSPIVSVVLLILIAVAASVLIYTWMSGLASKAPTTEPTLQEKIKITGVKITSSQVDLYVENLGSVTVNITSAYIIDAITNSVTCDNTTANTVVSPGATSIITISCSLTPGKVYIAKAVTERGTETYYTFTYTQG